MLKVEKDADFASNIFLFSFFYGLVHLGILNFREAEIPSFPFFTFFFNFTKNIFIKKSVQFSLIRFDDLGMLQIHKSLFSCLLEFW